MTWGGKRTGAGRKPGSQWDAQTKKIRNAFTAQKCNAGIRRIEWQFTFEEYVIWWGDDFNNRGRKIGQLVMARIGDKGPYHPDNCVKKTCSENVREGQSKPFITPIGQFNTLGEAAKVFGVTSETIRYRIKTCPNEYSYVQD